MKNSKFFTLSLAAALFSSSALAVSNEGISFDNRLVDAVNSNNFNIVDAILSTGENPNQVGKFETSALHRAAVNGNLEIAKLLIENGADVNIRDYGGASPLHVAARVGEIEFAKILIQNNADINSYDAQGFTPLHRAVVNKQAPISIFFIKAGAEVNTANNEGNTPIIDAVRNSDKAVLRELIIAGGDKGIRNNNGKDAIDFAIEEGNPEIDFLLSATASELVASDNSIPSFLKKEAKVSSQNNSFKQVFNDVVKVPTETIEAEDIQVLAPVKQVKQNVNNKKDFIAEEPLEIENNINLSANNNSSDNLPASMRNKVAVKVETKKIEPKKNIKTLDIKPKSIENKISNSINEKAAENNIIPANTKPVLEQTLPVFKEIEPVKEERKTEQKVERENKIKETKKVEKVKTVQQEIKNDIKPIALPKMQFIDIPMQIEEEANNKNILNFKSSEELANKDSQKENVIKLPKLEAAKQDIKIEKPKLKEAEAEKPIGKILPKKLEASDLGKIAPAAEIPASMRNKKPEILKAETKPAMPEKLALSKGLNIELPKDNFAPKASNATFPVVGLQVISINNYSENNTIEKISPEPQNIAKKPVIPNNVNNKSEALPTKIDDKYLNEVDSILNSANNFSTQLVDVNFEMVSQEKNLPASLMIKNFNENKITVVDEKPVSILKTQEEIEVAENILPENEAVEVVKQEEDFETSKPVTSNYDSYRASLVSNIKEFYNSNGKIRNTYSLENLEREREKTLGLSLREEQNFASENNQIFPATDVVAAPAAVVETENLANLSLNNMLEEVSVEAKKALGFSFTEKGFFAVIGSFESTNEAKNYMLEATNNFSEEIKFSVEKDSISNKYLVKIGAVENEDNAKKLCELFSSSNLTCDIN
jgi:ankyrin repeat protein